MGICGSGAIFCGPKRCETSIHGFSRRRSDSRGTNASPNAAPLPIPRCFSAASARSKFHPAQRSNTVMRTRGNRRTRRRPKPIFRLSPAFTDSPPARIAQFPPKTSVACSARREASRCSAALKLNQKPLDRHAHQPRAIKRDTCPRRCASNPAVDEKRPVPRPRSMPR